MKKETFCGLIWSIHEQRKREEIFGDTVAKAFMEAGEEPDFRDTYSYYPPTTKFIDSLLSEIAGDFVNENQSHEDALDWLNYYIYEVDMMDNLLEGVETTQEPNYRLCRTADGKEFHVKSPADLYDILMHEMEISQE